MQIIKELPRLPGGVAIGRPEVAFLARCSWDEVGKRVRRGELPAPDIRFGHRSLYWRADTVRQAFGIEAAKPEAA
jgi:hypothetical protein